MSERRRTESMRVSVTEDDRQAVKRIAARREVSEAQVVRWALREYLQKEENDERDD